MELVAQDWHVRHCGVTRVTVRNLSHPRYMSEHARPLSCVRGLTRARAIKSVVTGVGRARFLPASPGSGEAEPASLGSGEAEPVFPGSGEAEPASLRSGEAAVCVIYVSHEFVMALLALCLRHPGIDIRQ